MPMRHGSKLAKNGKTFVRFRDFFEHHVALFVNTMHLEYVLCQIQSDRRNLHRGRPFRSVDKLGISTLAHQRRFKEGATIPLIWILDG